ncbi:MAG: hypothetical protein PVS2B2_27100 [Candidatus Acidiferrum sp.]
MKCALFDDVSACSRIDAAADGLIALTVVDLDFEPKTIRVNKSADD